MVTAPTLTLAQQLAPLLRHLQARQLALAPTRDGGWGLVNAGDEWEATAPTIAALLVACGLVPDLPAPTLAAVVRSVLTAEWAGTLVVRERVEDALARAVPVADVAAVLRQLRRDGHAESRAVGDTGKAWRRAGGVAP